jgi:hypothetical protein
VVSKYELGHTLTEHELKTGIRELNPDMHFDLGGRLNLDHPSMNIWQGVWYGKKHITTMDRDTVTPIPEYEVWTLKSEWDPATKTIAKVRDSIVRWGWRNLFADLDRARIPGVSLLSLCNKFKVSVKYKNDYRPVATIDQVSQSQGGIIMATR